MFQMFSILVYTFLSASAMAQNSEPLPTAKSSEALSALAKANINVASVIEAIGREKWQVVVGPYNSKNVPNGMDPAEYLDKVRRFTFDECLFRTSEYLIEIRYCTGIGLPGMDVTWRLFHQFDIIVYGHGISLFYRIAGGGGVNEIDPMQATPSDLSRYDDVSMVLNAEPKFEEGKWNNLPVNDLIDIIINKQTGTIPFGDGLRFSLKTQKGLPAPECWESVRDMMSADNRSVQCPTSVARLSDEAVLWVNYPAKASLQAVQAYVEAMVRAFTDAGLQVKNSWND